jgi:hypothetical protein
MRQQTKAGTEEVNSAELSSENRQRKVFRKLWMVQQYMRRLSVRSCATVAEQTQNFQNFFCIFSTTFLQCFAMQKGIPRFCLILCVTSWVSQSAGLKIFERMCARLCLYQLLI